MSDVFVRIRALDETGSAFSRVADEVAEFRTTVIDTDSASRGAARSSRDLAIAAIDAGKGAQGGARDASSFSRELEGLGGSARTSGESLLNLGGVGRTALGVFGGIVGAGSLAAVASGFRDNAVEALGTADALNIVEANLRLTGDGASGFEARLKELVATTGGGKFTINEAANSLLLFADQALGADGSLLVLKAGMDLARATGADLRDTTAGLNDVLQSWGLTATDAARVAALLAQEKANTGANVRELSGDLATNGQALAGLGIPINEAIVLYGQLQQQGKGSSQDLITATLLLRDQTGETAKKLQALGIEFDASTGKGQSLVDVLAQAREKSILFEDVIAAFGPRLGPVVGGLAENFSAFEARIRETGHAGQDFDETLALIDDRKFPHLQSALDGARASVDRATEGALGFLDALVRIGQNPLGIEGFNVEAVQRDLASVLNPGALPGALKPAEGSPIDQVGDFITGLGGPARERIFGFAEGAIVRATPGGVLGVVGEGGRDELVAPLDRLPAILPGLSGGGTTTVTIGTIVVKDGTDLLSKLRSFGALRRA